MKNSVFLLGAGDRFNYGDLLFPLVVSNYLRRGNDDDIVFYNYGLVKSDLSRYGALPTKPIKVLYSDVVKSTEKNAICIVGGEVLGPSWLDLYACISPLFHKLTKNSYLNKFVNLNSIAQTWLGGRTDNAYIFNKEVLDNNAKIILNSVGGIFLPYLNGYRMPVLIRQLQDADFLSVRDLFTYDKMISLGVSNCHLVPDSAILMSELYMNDFLKNNFSKNNRIQIQKLSGEGYLFFQVNKVMGERHLSQIINVLTDISNSYNLKIVLCPIGTALSHEDHIPLKQISTRLKVPNVFINEVNIWEIMYLISNSKIFIGTSLHGIITAMSYMVPYIGVFKENRKIDEYLKTWGVDGLNYSHSELELLEKVSFAMNLPKEVLRNKLDGQVNKVKYSLSLIRNIIVGQQK